LTSSHVPVVSCAAASPAVAVISSLAPLLARASALVAVPTAADISSVTTCFQCFWSPGYTNVPADVGHPAILLTSLLLMASAVSNVPAVTTFMILLAILVLVLLSLLLLE
jgi:hypothetical protein